MANDKICVFCGEKVGLLGSSDMPCAGTFQPCCRICGGRDFFVLPRIA